MAGRPKINPAYCPTGIPLEVEGGSTSTHASTICSYQKHHCSCPGSVFPSSKGCHLPSARPTSLPVPYFHCSQGLQQAQTNYRSECPKQLYQLSHIPHDYSSAHCRSPFHSCLGGNNRPSGCLPSHPYSVQPASLPSLLFSKSTLLLPRPPIWPECRAGSLHPDTKMAPGHTEATRDQGGCLPGRLDRLGPISQGNQLCHTGHCSPPSVTRFSHKPEQVMPQSYPTAPLVGTPLEPTNGPLEPTSREDHQTVSAHTRRPCKFLLLSSTMGISTGSIELCSPISISSPPPPPEGATSPASGSTNLAGCSTLDSFLSPQFIGTLAPPTGPDIFGQILSCRSSSVPLDRRIPRRLGRAHSMPRGLRSLGHRCSVSSYKSVRNLRSSPNYPRSGPQKLPHSCLHRQSGCSVHHKQRQKQVPFSPSRSRIPHDRGPSQGSQAEGFSNIHPLEHQGRCTKQRSDPSRRGHTTRGSVRANSCVERTSTNRPHGHNSQCQTTLICEPFSGPQCTCSKCLQHRLEPVVPDLPVSPSLADSPSSRQAGRIQGSRSTSPSLAASRALVSEDNETHTQNPTLVTTPDWIHSLRSSDRIQFLKKVLTFKRGARVATHLLRAYRQSTNRQAQSVWKAFQEWLPPEVSVISPHLVMEYLIFLQETKHLSPRTILNYRGCLAWPLREAFNINLASTEFSLLARSQFLQCPPQPKKLPRWSIDTALTTYQSDRFSLRSVSESDLLLKTLFLTALASGNRASELAATVREGISYDHNSLTLPVMPTFLFKNQSLTNPAPPGIVFPSLPTNPNLCPVSFLNKYIRDTQHFSHEGFIFIHPRSHKPLKAGRLSYFLAKAIATGDPVGGSGHDIRKLSHSYAFARGLDIADIVKNGFWQSANVFVRNYLINTPSVPNKKFVAGRLNTC